MNEPFFARNSIMWVFLAKGVGDPLRTQLTGLFNVYIFDVFLPEPYLQVKRVKKGPGIYIPVIASQNPYDLYLLKLFSIFRPKYERLAN